jgi:hypothetical protein
VKRFGMACSLSCSSLTFARDVSRSRHDRP